MAGRRDQILDCAEVLIKRSGFAGFSYAEIAAEVGIRKASIHYHFPTKAELAEAAVARYRAQMRRSLADIDVAIVGAEGAVRGLVRIFREAFLGPGSGCLCASLAADWSELPEAVQAQVRIYWREAVSWLQQALRPPGEAEDHEPSQALVVFSLLEGAMTSARVLQDASVFSACEAAALSLVRSP